MAEEGSAGYAIFQNTGGTYMARNMITGRETQKMQEYTQEQIDRAEHMGIAFSTDVKEQIFEYANLNGEEEKVSTLVRNLSDALSQKDNDKAEELLDDAKMDIQDFRSQKRDTIILFTMKISV